MTSLSEQLQRLAIPQALQQREIRKKASLLFDQHVVGNLDRDTIFDIGVDGLKELVTFDAAFSQFSDNLFNVKSKHLDRTVETSAVITKLDSTIKKFLYLLSPYVLLKPAHKALEWLICRYHIQDFNTNDLMALILPYHESKLFAKVLQLINLKLPSSQNFFWLEKVQKEGVHLPKSVLANHAISDASFLRFICDAFVNIVEENKNSKGIEKLGTLVNFYCVTLINVMSKKHISDHHVTIMLPSLMFALNNESLNIKAAAYMICGQLVVSYQITNILLKEILTKIVNDTDDLKKERALLLSLIFQKQNNAHFPSACVSKLSSFKEILASLSAEGIYTEPILNNMKKLGLEQDDTNDNKADVNIVSSEVDSELKQSWNYIQQLKECQGDQKESAWLKFRPCLVNKFNDKKIFKELFEVAPSYDKLVLMLCLDKILKMSKRRQRSFLHDILHSNFGEKNPYLQEINNSLETEKSIEEILETIVLKQHKEYDNPVEFEPWLAALNELNSLKEFSDSYHLLELGLRVLIAALPSEFSATHALHILNFLKKLKREKVEKRFDVIHALINYMSRKKSEHSVWHDLSNKNPEIWLKVRLLEYILEGRCVENGSEQTYNAILDKFSELAFSSKGELSILNSAVCAGTPFENPDSAFYISPQLQIYSLYVSWSQLMKNDESLSDYFSSELNRTVVYILICLSSPWAPIRKATFNVVELLASLLDTNDEAIFFLKQLISRREEILADHEQLNVALYYMLSPSKSVIATLEADAVAKFSVIRRRFVQIITNEHTPLYVSAVLLNVMEAVNSQEILMQLGPLCSRSISHSKDSSIARSVLSNFWSRVNEETANVLEKQEIWELVVQCMKHPKCEELNPAVSFLKTVTKEVFDNLTDLRKFQLLELLVSVRSDTDCNELATAIASAVKRINIDCKIILPLVKKMTVTSNSPHKTRDSGKVASIIESQNWKAGVSLLELIQSKKKLQSPDLLLQPLFNVLQFCFTQEEQTTFEYAKQLVLGCLLNCCQKLTLNSQNVDESSLNVELAVQCLRASPNPQTHHHALLLLSCLAAIVPNQVIHNIMAIFTFMGTSVARLDDEHSVKIVTQVVDAVVPVLLKSMSTETRNAQKVIAEILLVFVWALKDIPQHRRIPLFLQLLTTLQPEKSLWILLMLLVENYVLHGNPTKIEALPTNLFLGLQLTICMTPQVILESILKMVHYLNSLPTEKLNRDGSPVKMCPSKYYRSASDKSKKLFDIESSGSKQLRQFTHTILTFLNILLSNNTVITQVSEENKDDNSLEPAFRETIALIMKYIQTAVMQYETDHDKFWKAVTHQCYEILDKFVSLVPGEMLLCVIKQLLYHSKGSLRKKALDLFNALLQNRKENLSESEKLSLIELLKPILLIVREIHDNVEQEYEILQQTALISLKLLSKLLCFENINMFKEILTDLCKIAKKCEGHLLGSVILAIADQVTCLKVHSVFLLPSIMPLMLDNLPENTEQEKVTELGLLSVVTALYKVVDVLPHFLSPYLPNLLYKVCCISVNASEGSDLNKKLSLIRQKIANNLESRILIPSIANCCENLISNRKYDAVGHVLNVLSANITVSLDVVKLIPDLTKFFFNALTFRSSADSSEITLDDVDKVEGFTIDALVQFVLKLSESSFRPLYYQLCHWASGIPSRNITFYRLSCRLAENLKGLFVLFASHFLNDAANLLDKLNVSKVESCYFGDSENAEYQSILLLESIIKTLHLVFLYDSADTSNFLNKDKFEVLLHPLVDQLENQLGGLPQLEERRKRLITPCLAQMALATDDILWKSLNYQILAKTKSNVPQIRIGALETIVAMATKLGEDYLTLLPETIGSLAELLEDDDENVETAMKKAILELEDVLGQPLREYFQQ